MSFAIAGGAYLRAKKGAMAWVSKAEYSAEGVVEEIVVGDAPGGVEGEVT